MERLDENWVTNGLIDFEYKKYILLSYLKTVRENFNDKRLFPYMSDLIFHYQNLQLFKERKEVIVKNFPKEISEADFKNLKIYYKKLIEDDEIMEELTTIINYSSRKMKSSLDEGKEVYDTLEKAIQIIPIGLVPLNFSEGYVFLTETKNSFYQVYRYVITVFENSVDRYRAINFRYMGSFRKLISETYENVKRNLIRQYKELPNPATYLIQSEIELPYEETYLPIAKRMLVKYVNSAA